MQFKPDMIGLIRYGHKTQTRRPVGPHDTYGHRGPEVFWVKRKGRLLWQVGNWYSICPGRGMRGEGLMRLMAIRQELVSAISEDDARAEGFEDRAEFLERWRALYPKAGPNDLAWALTFEFAGAEA